MKALAADPELWSRQRWVATVFFLVAAQAGLVVLLSDRSPEIPIPEASGLSVRVITDPAESAALFDSLTAGDPTLLTLIHPQPSAGGRPSFVAPELPQPGDSMEPPRWLSQDQSRLGTTFAGFLRTNVAFPADRAQNPAPPPVTAAIAEPLLDRDSSVAFRGELAGRELRVPVRLPVWTNGDLLASTVVQVSVNAAGEVFAPRLEKGPAAAGIQRDADLRAVDLVRTMRFKPLPAGATGGRLSSPGKIEFKWRTVPPPDTDERSAAPPP